MLNDRLMDIEYMLPRMVLPYGGVGVVNAKKDFCAFGFFSRWVLIVKSIGLMQAPFGHEYPNCRRETTRDSSPSNPPGMFSLPSTIPMWSLLYCTLLEEKWP